MIPNCFVKISFLFACFSFDSDKKFGSLERIVACMVCSDTKWKCLSWTSYVPSLLHFNQTYFMDWIHVSHINYSVCMFQFTGLKVVKYDFTYCSYCASVVYCIFRYITSFRLLIWQRFFSTTILISLISFHLTFKMDFSLYIVALLNCNHSIL